LIAIQGDHDRTCRKNLYQQMLDAVATHRVADRPDRVEPRLRKRRPKKYDSMLEPRHVIKRKMLKRVTEN
jgi:DNA repair exonuclease SbcCD nuclease subunit